MSQSPPSVTSGLSLHRATVVLFDVDGTLIDSNEAHADTWARALSERGFPSDSSRIRPLVGMGSDKLLPTVGIDPESPTGTAVQRRKKELFAERLSGLRPTRGARELVAFLRGRRKKLVIATSADDEEMHALLRQADVADLIERRTSKDDAARSKPDPDIVLAALHLGGATASQTLMIGDTPYDIESARRAGVDPIALRCGGFWSADELGAALATFDDPADLLQYWEKVDANSSR